MPTRGHLVRRYFTPYEVAAHCRPEDAWVSFLGGVYDITKLIKNHPGKISEPLIQAAGTDISHWFDAKTREVRTMVCPVTQLVRPYTPQGVFPHIPPIEPMGNWDTSFGIAWWRDKQYQLGKLSSKLRVVRMKNVLTGQEDNMEVPSEETVVEIRERYLELNWHSKSYTVKALVRTPDAGFEFMELDMNKTLEENGVPDEEEMFEDLQVPQSAFYPVLHMYWNDDLTTA